MKRMKRIVLSLMVIVVATAAVAAGTSAFFSDTEVSEGNIMTAGSVDLKIDHTWAIYNDEICNQDCTVVGQNLLSNWSFERPVVTDHGGEWELFETIPGWTRVGDPLIELQRTVYTSHQGDQHLELDSDPSENSASSIEQTFSTVPGTRYRVIFWVSPRPGEASIGSGATLEVTALSAEGTALKENITTGAGAINWRRESYDFTAIDTETTLRFSLYGTPTTYGGLIDAVRVVELACEPIEEHEDWACELWPSKDLENEKFFNFSDIKPGDWGGNVISYRVDDNDAHVCLLTENLVDVAGDNGGELSDAIYLKIYPSDGYPMPTEGSEPLWQGYLSTLPQAGLGTVVGEETNYIWLEWCAGYDVGEGQCDGSIMGNEYQASSLTADLGFYAVQSRHNEEFDCSDLVWGDNFPTEERERETR